MARVDRDRRYFSWKFMAILAVLLIGLFCAALYWVRADIRKFQAQDDALRLTINAMDMEHANLESELSRVGSDGYVENEARQHHHFIREGEIVFAFEDPDVLKGYTEEEYQIIMDEMRD